VAQACQEDWRKFGQIIFAILTGENFATIGQDRLPTVSVGKLCVQPVDKPLRALWRKRVNRIGEKIANNICAFEWRKFRQSY